VGGTRYPAIVRLWHHAWQEYIPFLEYEIEVRGVKFSANAAGSRNARYPRAVRVRGNLPIEQAALKCCTWSPTP
jgi:putative transposase